MLTMNINIHISLYQKLKNYSSDNKNNLALARLFLKKDDFDDIVIKT